MSISQTVNINVLGFGVMGRQICGLLHTLGFDLTVWSRSPTQTNAQKLAAEVRKIHRLAGINPSDTAACRFVTRLDELEPCLTIEVLIEDIEVKKAVIAQLRYGFDSHNLLTNTSSFRPDEIHPSAVGLHFFNPLHTLRFIEHCDNGNVLFPDTSQLLAALQTAGYQIVPVKSNRGYVGNFLLFREISDVFSLIELHGYSLEQIENEYRLLGKAFHVIDIIDLVGVDVTVQIMRNLHTPMDPIRVPAILVSAWQEGVLGRKNNTSIKSLMKK
jgi:3-hydroxybutyryl-CoA dehydrogenase